MNCGTARLSLTRLVHQPDERAGVPNGPRHLRILLNRFSSCSIFWQALQIFALSRGGLVVSVALLGMGLPHKVLMRFEAR